MYLFLGVLLKYLGMKLDEISYIKFSRSPRPPKETLESFCIKNIFIKELTNDMLLNLVRHWVIVRFLLLENRCLVFIQVVVKV